MYNYLAFHLGDLVKILQVLFHLSGVPKLLFALKLAAYCAVTRAVSRPVTRTIIVLVTAQYWSLFCITSLLIG